MVRPASCPPPCYVGFFCGRSTKTPWQTKAKPSSIRSVAVRAAKDCVSVDHMDSPTLWFVTEMKVQLTKAWYQVATVFFGSPQPAELRESIAVDKFEGVGKRQARF